MRVRDGMRTPPKADVGRERTMRTLKHMGRQRGGDRIQDAGATDDEAGATIGRRDDGRLSFSAGDDRTRRKTEPKLEPEAEEIRTSEWFS